MRTRHSLRRTLEKTLRPYLQKLRQQAQATPAGIRKQMLLCISASLLLTILVFFLGLQDGTLKEGFRLPRSGYGGSKQYITLEVSGLTEDTSVPLDITVSPKRYTEEEADAVFREIYEQLEELVVAEGESFANLQHDLHLMTKLPKYGVQLSWDFYPELDPALAAGSVPQDDSVSAEAWTEDEVPQDKDAPAEALDEDEVPQDADAAAIAMAEQREAARAYYRKYRHLMDSDGTLHNETLPPGTVVTGYLSLIMSTDIVPENVDGETKYLKTQYHSAPYRIYVGIVPRELSRYESLLLQLQQAITAEDEGSLGENMLSLPTEIDGQRIYYSEHEDRSYLLLPLLGVVAAMAIYMRQGQARRTEKKQREALLMLDYSELVSKLMVYIGAGLTVRNALETISQHFDALIARGIKEDRPLYQELRTMVIQFRRNMPESEIYLSFGRRVNLKPYTKLVSLIEQNRMNGARNLRAMLELEMEDAFEQRKTTARRLGEEAGTKLLLPLFIMLGIVMIIVIVPAMSALG
ncbi:MAG: type II secretion system F family protein [Lachnospiraceae bacterium]|nr:type II secretion system F family protein [Lachnospiraceae bacterium]